MKKRLTAFLTLLLLLFGGANAQRDSINAYLLTCQPGKAIYELYGHSAIWIEDIASGSDLVFNYGLFDFNTPHFIWRFSLGQTDYILGVTRLDHFLHEYHDRGSKVFAQRLNLTQHESRRLYELLIDNSRKENRVYRYNFLFNNCATMAIDKVEQSINGIVQYDSPRDGLTFSDLLTEHTVISPWSEFAVDLVIGSSADSAMGYREEAFAPLYLHQLVESATITDTAGVTRPLALESREIARPDHEVEFGTPLLTPLQLMCTLFSVLLLLTLLGWYKSRTFWLIDAILFGVQGVAGIVIALLFFFSEHPAVDTNWLVICLNPLPLLFMPFAIRKVRQKRVSLFYIAELVVCLTFLILSNVIPQTIGLSILAIIAMFALRALSTLLFTLCHGTICKSKSSCRGGKAISMLLLATMLSTPMMAAGEVRPKLVVGIVIDQLNSDNLRTMLPLMGTDGLKRLWTDGYNRDNATFDYDGTDIASGVASVHTGASPFQHGIVAARWMNRKTLMAASPLDDSAYSGINTIQHTSPQRLLSTNLADEIKLESSGRSQVCAIAAEREASVLSAGHEADVCIWISPDNGKWCSSQYYGSLPVWVENLNDSLVNNWEWRPSLSVDNYLQFTGYHTGRPFSHSIRRGERKEFMTSPASNEQVLTAALAALEGMRLGRDDTPDLLALTFYAGNYGHQTNSIRSMEQQDIYLRLDKDIARLIRETDSIVGAENVLYFVTSTGYSDYSAPDLGNTRIPTGTVNMERATALLNLYLSAKYGSDKYIETYYQNQIYLNHRLIEDKGIAMHEIMENSVDLLVQLSGIKSIILLRDLMATIPDIDSARKRNGYNNSFTGDIIIDAIPGWGITDDNEGRTDYRRPTPQPFPMIIYGNKVRAEINHEPISVSRLIPTICSIIGCNAPNASYSNPLTGLK